jgi:hypothetical protein
MALDHSGPFDGAANEAIDKITAVITTAVPKAIHELINTSSEITVRLLPERFKNSGAVRSRPSNHLIS